MPFGIQARDQSVLNFVRVAENIAVVKVQNTCEVLHARDISVYDAGFNDVFPLASQELPIENSFQSGRAQFHGSLEGFAVGGFLLGATVYEAFGVIGLMQGESRPKIPTSPLQRERNLRV